MTCAPAIADRLLAWYDAHGRKDLPWQRARNPYRIWLAEIMLQQTQVGAVIPYYRRFLRRFPSLRALAAADIDAVLRHWAGLGYYARARNLHAAARQIADRHGGRFPRRFEDIAALPGVGRSTAGAIAAFAFGQRRAILDGNVKRVLSRYCALDGAPGANTQAQLWRIAEAQLPPARVADYNQALMDVGATVCARAKPKCGVCPLAADCRAHLAGNPADYPAAKSRPARRRQAVTMLIIRDRRGHVLLVQRPPRGIWGGLWSLPEYPHRAAGKSAATATTAKAAAWRTKAGVTSAERRRIEAWCEKQFGVAVAAGRTLPAFTHAFTHFDLDIRPLLADCAGDARVDGARHVWYNPCAPAAVGVPAAAAKIFNLIRTVETSNR